MWFQIPQCCLMLACTAFKCCDPSVRETVEISRGSKANYSNSCTPKGNELVKLTICAALIPRRQKPVGKLGFLWQHTEAPAVSPPHGDMCQGPLSAETRAWQLSGQSRYLKKKKYERGPLRCALSSSPAVPRVLGTSSGGLTICGYL